MPTPSRRFVNLLTLFPFTLLGCGEEAAPDPIDAVMCGNMTVEAEEACDDGNLEHFDGCDNECRDTGHAVMPELPGGLLQVVTSADRIFVALDGGTIVVLDASGKRLKDLTPKHGVPRKMAGDGGGGLVAAGSLHDEASGFQGQWLEYFPAAGASRLVLNETPSEYVPTVFASASSGLFGFAHAMEDWRVDDGLLYELTAYKDQSTPVINVARTATIPHFDQTSAADFYIRGIDVAEVDGGFQLLFRGHSEQTDDIGFPRTAFVALDAGGEQLSASSCDLDAAHLLDDGTIVAVVDGALAVDPDGTDGCLTQTADERLAGTRASLWSHNDVIRSQGTLLIGDTEVKVSSGQPEVLATWDVPYDWESWGRALLANGKLIVYGGNTSVTELAILDTDFRQTELEVPEASDDGSDCVLDVQCRSALCEEGTCAARGLEAGAVCTSPSQCVSGQCEANVCL